MRDIDLAWLGFAEEAREFQRGSLYPSDVGYDSEQAYVAAQRIASMLGPVADAYEDSDKPRTARFLREFAIPSLFIPLHCPIGYGDIKELWGWMIPYLCAAAQEAGKRADLVGLPTWCCVSYRSYLNTDVALDECLSSDGNPLGDEAFPPLDVQRVYTCESGRVAAASSHFSLLFHPSASGRAQFDPNNRWSMDRMSHQVGRIYVPSACLTERIEDAYVHLLACLSYNSRHVSRRSDPTGDWWQQYLSMRRSYIEFALALDCF